jgi:hypothetical protein
MQRSRIGIGLCLLFVMAGSASAQQVFIDYDHRAPFSDYRTYTWVRKPRTPDPFMADRIVDAVNAQLAAKGWQLVPANADVGIAANVATRRARTVESFYSGFPGWRWGWGPGAVTTTVNTYPVGTLVVDFFDAHEKRIVWRGVAREALSENPGKDTKKLNKAVEKLLKNFPPKR